MKRVLDLIIKCLLIMGASSCNIDEVTITSLPAEIIIDGSGNYRTRVGDTITISPQYKNCEEATFCWTIDQEIVCRESDYTHLAESVGKVTIKLVVTNESGSTEQLFTIDIIDHFKVYDYTPAPGQFINELKTSGFDGTQTTLESAIAYAEKRLLEDKFVSLGAFGGYIVVGFDQSVSNIDSYDFAIGNNAFDSSSEPGVVWVMQDENGDGEPNDTWYELSGSESGKEETQQNYEITYYRPEASEMDVTWSDNMGNSGAVKYLKDFHDQDSYYPAWIEADSYTLRGTLLKSRSFDSSGNGSKWVNPAFDWGYADNASTIDNQQRENLFEISNAIDDKGNAVTLDYIDFIKVQSAIQQQCGWIGEVSTEVTSFRVIQNE